MFINSGNFRGLFWTQCLGAFVDNYYKSFLMVWIVYHLPANNPYDPKLLITLASALFIVPFFIFSSLAGELSAKYEKTKLIQLTKWWEVGLVVLSILAFWFHSLPWMMAVLFLLGTQSAFFGPMKYSILPQMIEKENLLKANGWVEMGTFLAILVGTLLGSLTLTRDSHLFYFSGIILTATLLGLFFSYSIPATTPENSHQPIHVNFIARTFHQMKELKKDDRMFWMIQMISWFWFLGIIILTLIPIIAKDLLHEGEETVSLLLTCMSLMIGIGSITCHSISKKIPPLKVASFSAFFVALFLMMLSISHTKPTFLLNLSIFSFFCGLYVVPLYTFLQQEHSVFLKSHLIAMLNIFNSLWMVIASVFLTIVLQKTSVSAVFLWLGFACLGQSLLFHRLTVTNLRK
jgi:acyl-[acyl-carrier-protein]-phospholipid O-acyltransferase/long-chain-fatty-acid--[acyl-carrier-protein] ligase